MRRRRLRIGENVPFPVLMVVFLILLPIVGAGPWLVTWNSANEALVSVFGVGGLPFITKNTQLVQPAENRSPNPRTSHVKPKMVTWFLLSA